MNPAHRIDLAMQAAGIKSQATLAKETGVSPAVLSRLLKGTSLPGVETLDAIAQRLNVTLDWIMHGEDKPQTDAAVMPLIHVSQEELKLVTQYRLSTPQGRAAIKAAANDSEKQHSPPESTPNLPGAEA